MFQSALYFFKGGVKVSQQKIAASELFSEIMHLLKDEFIAKIDGDGKDILIEFINGQKFSLALTEVN